MRRRTTTRAAAFLSAVAALGALPFAALPFTALAASPGSASTSGGTSPASRSAPAPASRSTHAGGSGTASQQQGPRAQAGNQIVTASGNGITFSTRASGMLNHGLTFTGSLANAHSGETVEIQRLGRQTGGRWANTAHGITDAQGDFTAVWPANHIGRFEVRAVLRQGSSARTASASPPVTVTVYRSAIATIFGPGFYGSRTACGEILHPDTIGVANRTLPCGTPVAILYRGRTLVVPVIDRGPYANHADWDLTEATARALGVNDTVTIGAVSLRGGR